MLKAAVRPRSSIADFLQAIAHVRDASPAVETALQAYTIAERQNDMAGGVIRLGGSTYAAISANQCLANLKRTEAILWSAVDACGGTCRLADGRYIATRQALISGEKFRWVRITRVEHEHSPGEFDAFTRGDMQ